MSKSEQNRAPVEAQFFEDVDSLVREAIQNSLDAVDRTSGDKGPVRVRFFISGNLAAVPRERARVWMTGLSPHLSAAIEEAVEFDSAMPFLSIEDFGTRGLTGRTDVAREIDIPSGERADFFYFWRNVGMTGKSGSERGSWGLGKAVYAASSRAHAMLGWSVRANSPPSVLMGQSSLRLHTLYDGHGRPQQHDAYGFFGEFVDGDDPAFATPVADTDTIDAFRRDFRLERESSERGLSMVIPFPREEFLGADGLERLVRAVILHFAYPVLAGQLIVEVASPEETHIIDGSRIESTLKALHWERREAQRDRILELLELTRWTLRNDNAVVPLGTRDTIGASWDQVVLPEDEWQLARERFTSREPVGFSVPVIVRPKAAEKVDTWFRVFLRQRETSQPNLVHFIRQGLTISEIPGVAGTGLVGVVLVDDEHLSRLLRDSENPAHTRWNTRSEKLKARYTGGPARIEFVCAAPRMLLRRLIEGEQDTDTEMLADLFPEPVEDSPMPGTRKSTKRGRKTQPLPPPPPPRPKPISITRIDGGFVVARNPEIPVSEPDDELIIEAAYDCVSGNPFKAWEEYDFQFGRDLLAEVDGGEIIRAEHNQLRVKPGQTFKLRVTGFSPTRDLIIRHRWLRNGGAEA